MQLVYGDQIDVKLLIGCVYEDVNEYWKEYELTDEGMVNWARESRELMGVPMRVDYRREEFPPSVLPASLAVIAALRQGSVERFLRELLRRFVVEGEDVTKDGVLVKAASEAGLDVKHFSKDLSDRDVRKHELENQGEGFPHLPLGFYNLIVTDGQDRSVLLDNAFNPKTVEEAIDYLSGDSLTKQVPRNIEGYLREHGPTPQVEIERVFGFTSSEAEKKLKGLSKNGVTGRVLAEGRFWQTK